MILNIINLCPDYFIDPYANDELKKEIARGREENVLSIAAQSKQHGFAVRFWEGNTDETVFRCGNISRAFKKIVKYAKEIGLSMVCIGEDDVEFTAPGAWQYYLNNLPDDYDIYLGGIYSGQLSGNRISNGYSGHTLITVHERAYDFILSADEKDHLDRWCGNHCFEKRLIVCMPFVVKNKPGYSENHRRMQNYDAYELGWEYFSGM